MTVQSIPMPATRHEWLALRKKFIGASEIGALFGVHPYKTAAALFADKLGLTPDNDAGGPATRGIKLEPFVASQIQEQHPDWKVEKATDYFFDDDRLIAATPDYFVTKPDGWRGPLDIKTVDERKFKEVWLEDDGTIVPEPFILLQVIQQQLLAGGDGAMVGVLPVSGWAPFDVHIIDVPLSPFVADKILVKAAEFWDRIRRHDPPAFDPSRDLETIKALYPAAEAGKEINLRGDNEIRNLLDRRELCKEAIKANSATVESIDAQILAKLGDAESAIVDGWHLTLKTQHRSGYSVGPKDFRVLRAKRLHSDRIMG